MPQPKEIADALAPLLKAWREAGQELAQREAALFAELTRAIDTGQRGAVRRALRNVRALQERVDVDMAALVAETRRWLETDLTMIWHAGATEAASMIGGTWIWTPTAITAVELLANDTFSTVLSASKFTSNDTKRWISEVAAEAARLSGTVGDTSTQAARRTAKQLKVRKIASVRYKDGSHRSIDDYADMLLRTRIAEAYSAAGTQVYKSAGVQFVELSDGPGCGLLSHKGSPAADGLIVPLEVHEAVPLAHPRCTRSAIPRLDLNGKIPSEAAAAPLLRTPEQVQAQRSFRESLDAQNKTVTGRRRKVASRRTRS